MKRLLRLPHRVSPSTCYVNGLEDILRWKGGRYTEYLLPVLGGMGEFAYFRFEKASPPCMVYWGANPKYLMKDLEPIIGFEQIVSENRAFKGTFARVKDLIDQDRPVVAGALDMYHLQYYPQLYHQQHIPIHYILVVGYDDDTQELYVQDCSHEGVQQVPYDGFERALDVNVPGMSKKNTIRAFALPPSLPSEVEIARKGLALRAAKMLNPPVKMFGIPAMRKLAKEITGWKDQACFEHLVTYATTPPELPRTFEQSDGMRSWKSKVLRELGKKYHIEAWTRASAMFEESGTLIKGLCRAALKQDRASVSALIARIADIEEAAYGLML